MTKHILILGVILTSFSACTDDQGCQPCSAILTTEMDGEGNKYSQYDYN